MRLAAALLLVLAACSDDGDPTTSLPNPSSSTGGSTAAESTGEPADLPEGALCTAQGQCAEGLVCEKVGREPNCYVPTCAKPCSSDDECGQWEHCDLACVLGCRTPVGGSCMHSQECQSDVCREGKCIWACDKNNPCPEGQACHVFPEPTPNDFGECVPS